MRAVTAVPRLAVMVLSSAVIRAVLLASSALMRVVSAAVFAAAVAVSVDMASFVATSLAAAVAVSADMASFAATSRELPSAVIWLAMEVTVAVRPEVTSSSCEATSARSWVWNASWAVFMATRPNPTSKMKRHQELEIAMVEIASMHGFAVLTAVDVGGGVDGGLECGLAGLASGGKCIRFALELSDAVVEGNHVNGLPGLDTCEQQETDSMGTMMAKG